MFPADQRHTRKARCDLQTGPPGQDRRFSSVSAKMSCPAPRSWNGPSLGVEARYRAPFPSILKSSKPSREIPPRSRFASWFPCQSGEGAFRETHRCPDGSGFHRQRTHGISCRHGSAHGVDDVGVALGIDDAAILRSRARQFAKMDTLKNRIQYQGVISFCLGIPTSMFAKMDALPQKCFIISVRYANPDVLQNRTRSTG